MSLILPGSPSWAYCTDNLTATPDAALPGTTVPSGSGNADGTTTQILAALAHDVCYLVIGIGGMGATTTGEDNSCLLDVLIDPAGGTAWASFIDDLICGYHSTQIAGRDSLNVWYHFPVWIKDGTAIAVRCRKNGATSNNGQVVMYAFGGPKNPSMWWCGRKVESLGINASTSKGTAVTPGASGSYSWTNIGTSTRRYGAIQVGIGGSDSSMQAKGFKWQIGVNSARLGGTPTIYTSDSTSEICQRAGMCMPIFKHVKAGTTLQVGGACSTTAPEAHDCAIYGVN